MEQTRNFGARRVFVAGDNETELTLIAELLEQEGHEVALARSGAQALEILSERDFDILFLDAELPDIDGVSLLRAYRFGKLDPPPVFLIAADTGRQAEKKLKEAGAAGLIDKSGISSQALRQALALARSPLPLPAAAGEQHAAPILAARHPPQLKVVTAQFLDRAVVQGLKSFSANPDFVPILLTVAAEDIARIADSLAQALAARDGERVRELAHGMKGVAASVGAMRLVAFTNTLMRAARDPDAGGRLAQELDEVSRGTVAALLEFVEALRRRQGRGRK